MYLYVIRNTLRNILRETKMKEDRIFFEWEHRTVAVEVTAASYSMFSKSSRNACRSGQ